VNSIVNSIDWQLLKKQKQTLLKIWFESEKFPNLSPSEFEDIEGIIYTIDFIQDTVVDKGYKPEKEVFDTEVTA
jgi:hypothetical protein